MPESKRINIGSGERRLQGYVNVDILPGADVVCDITKGLPWGKEEIEEVVADYVLCQIKEIKYVLNEIWRVLKPGGLLKLKVPDARFPCAFQDPMDCRYFVRETFDYFNKNHYRYKALHYGFKPWEIKVIARERSDRLYVEMRKPLWIQMLKK